MNDIHSITLESDERGYTLLLETEDEGTTTGFLNDIAVMRQLLVAARHVQSYVDSHDEALAAWQALNNQSDALFRTFVDIARTDDRLHQEGLK